jgi:PAS domain S-box-containing protein
MPHPLNAVVVAAFVAELVGTLLTLAALVGLRRGFPRPHLAAWSWAWGAWLAHEAGSFFLALKAGPGPSGTALRIAVLLLAYAQAGGLVLGACEFARGAGLSAKARRAFVALLSGLAVASTGALATGLPIEGAALVRFVLPLFTLGAASLAAASIVARRQPAPPALGDRLLASALAVYGGIRVYEGGFSLVWLATGRFPAHLVYLGFLDFLVLGILGLGTIVCLLEDEHRALLADVGERKKAERALALSEDRFSKVFRSSPDSISISSLADGRYLDVNGAFERAFGYARAEVVGRSALEIGIWVDPQQREQWVARLRKEGGVRDVVVDLRTRSRQRRVCSLAAEVIHLDEGEFVVTTARDITDWLAGEARVRDSEERLRLALDAARMGTWEWEVTTGAVAWSPRVDALIGLPAGTLASARSYLDLVHPEDRRKVTDSIDRILHGTPEEFQEEHRILTTAGASRWLEARGRIDRDPAGKPLRVRGTVADITARKEAHLSLLDREERLRRISEAAFEGIGFSENGRVIDANSQLAAMLGYTVPELLGRPVSDFVAPVDQARVEESLRGRAASSYEHRAIRKDGSTFTVEVQGRPLDVAGRALRVTAVRDVSERTRLEAALQRSETLSAVGALVTGVAHEVRTPLFSISATLDAYEGQLASEQERGEFMGLLRSQVKRLTNLMTDLLDYAKPPALSLTRGSLATVLHRAVVACRGAATEAGVDLEEDVSRELGDVERDEGRLEQVFQNLIANAVQLAPRGSAVLVTARPDLEGISCTVEDRGPGLPGGESQRVFEPFFTRRKGGTGLGLSIVRRIVEEHGGSVTAGNRPQGGAVFTVWLPLAGEPVSRAAP